MAKKKLKEATYIRLRDGRLIGPYQDADRYYSEGLLGIKIEDKWGYLDEEGNIVISPQYDKVNEFSNGMATICVEGKYGFIDTSGKTIVEPIYDKVFMFREGLCRVMVDGKCGFVNLEGKLIIPIEFDEPYNPKYFCFFDNGYAYVKKNGKEGLINKEGNYIFKPEYDNIACWKKLFRLQKDSKQELQDLNGNIVVPAGKYSFDLLKDDYILVKENEENSIVLFGLMDPEANLLIKPKYEEMEDFYEGLAKVKSNNKYGFIDFTGSEVIPTKYDESQHFVNGYSEIKFDGKIGIIDQRGNYAIDPELDYIGYGSNGFIPVKTDNKYGFVTEDWKWVAKPQFDDVNDFSEGLAAIKLNGKWGFANTDNGQIVINPEFKRVNKFTNGMAVCEIDNENKVLIDKQGKILLSDIQDVNREIHFICGLEPIKVDGKYGFINKEALLAVQPQYDKAKPFIEEYGLSPVQINRKWGLINIKGEITIAPQFDYIYGIHEDMMAVNIGNDNVRYFNVAEKSLIEGEFESDNSYSTTNFKNGYAIQKTKKKFGLLDKKGNWIIEPTFKTADAIENNNGLSIYRFGYA